MENNDRTCLEQLNAYSDELNLGFAKFETIGDLIESHRSMRNATIQTNEIWNKQLEEAKQAAWDQVTKGNTIFDKNNSEWVKVDRLKNMTVQEFLNQFSDFPY
jgi:hypothetical protein